jgi:hypothetical protein
LHAGTLSELKHKADQALWQIDGSAMSC